MPAVVGWRRVCQQCPWNPGEKPERSLHPNPVRAAHMHARGRNGHARRPRRRTGSRSSTNLAGGVTGGLVTFLELDGAAVRRYTLVSSKRPAARRVWGKDPGRRKIGRDLWLTRPSDPAF